MAQTLRKRPKKWLKIDLLLPLVSHMAKPMSKSAWHHPSPVAEVHWKNFGRNLMTGSALTAQLFLNSAQLIRVASFFGQRQIVQMDMFSKKMVFILSLARVR